MNKIPIVFAFDNKIIDPACVCMTSLMEHARESTFYEFIIVHSAKELSNKEHLNRIPQKYSNCDIRYIEIDNTFEKSFEIRGVTIATYYRLLLADLILDYDKVIYSDVDIIYRMDLSEVYNTDIEDNYLAATLDLGLNYLDKSHISKSSILEFGHYIQAGFAVFNLKKIREDNLTSVFKEHAIQKKYTYQDQDILNICCKNKIKYLPPYYNVNDCAYLVLQNPERMGGIFTESECNYAKNHGNIHYSGKKPWKENSIFMDVWWEFYRKSPIYDVDVHFRHFFNMTFMLDTIFFWDRVKLLVRYFVYGRAKI